MPRRYTYTPRRGREPEGGDVSSFAVLSGLIAVVAVIVIAVVAMSGGESRALPEGTCAGEDCAPLVAAATEAPAATQTTGPPTAPPTATPSYDEPAPAISGFSAAIVEAACGAVIYSQNETLRLAPASLTKIMTAIVALENAEPDEIVDIGIDGAGLALAADATAMGVKPGDRLTVLDLLHGLLLRSGLDAAVILAEYIAGDEASFVVLMNERAASLGLADTHFANASGIDDAGQYTSATDIAALGTVLLRDPALAEIVRTKEYQPAWERGPIENINLMLNVYDGAIGVKTGFTDEAGQTIVAAADRDGRRLIASVLHSEDLYVDASALLDWAFANTDPAC
jgi:D-alanyl-D-alanine carboxypeptidase